MFSTHVNLYVSFLMSGTSLTRLCLPPPVVFFIHQMVTSAEGHQMGVVRRRGDGDGARAAHVGVAQLVGEELELITAEAVVVPQDVIVGRPARALQGDQRRLRPRTKQRRGSARMEVTWIPA